MPSTSNTRFKRHTAWLLLMVWLFALSAGVANACLLERPGVPAHAALEHGGPADTPATPCLKLSDDGTRLLVKLPSGLDHAEPDAAPLVAVVWSLTVPVAMAPRAPGHRQGGLPELPIRVRYSRLAL